MKKWAKCKCGKEASRLEYADHGSGPQLVRLECEKCNTERLALEKAEQMKFAKNIKRAGHFSLRDIIAPVQGMGRTAKLQNFWLSVFARHDIRTPQDLQDKSAKLWKMRNLGRGKIAGIIMSAGRLGLVVAPFPNCLKE